MHRKRSKQSWTSTTGQSLEYELTVTLRHGHLEYLCELDAQWSHTPFTIEQTAADFLAQGQPAELGAWSLSDAQLEALRLRLAGKIVDVLEPAVAARFADALATASRDAAAPGLDAFSPPRGRLLGLLDGDTAAGCVGIRPIAGAPADVGELVVVYRARRYGLAEVPVLLGEHLLDEAPRLGYGVVFARADGLLFGELGDLGFAPASAPPAPGSHDRWMHLSL